LQEKLYACIYIAFVPEIGFFAHASPPTLLPRRNLLPRAQPRGREAPAF
jgi:hypothetical protein